MILGSTVGAVAAVLSYHPAASSTSTLLAPSPDTQVDTAVESSTPVAPTSETPSATPSASAEPSAQPSTQATAPAKKKSPAKKKKAPATSTTTKKSSGSSSSANATTSESQSIQSSQSTQSSQSSSTSESAPAPTQSASPEPKVAKNQVVTGATAQTRWGPVQVQITVKDGKIVDATALQYPNGDRRSQWISEQAIPWLIEETLTEQSANVQNIGGATYTTKGWRQSLASAIQKAGL